MLKKLCKGTHIFMEQAITNPALIVMRLLVDGKFANWSHKLHTAPVSYTWHTMHVLQV